METPSTLHITKTALLPPMSAGFRIPQEILMEIFRLTYRPQIIRLDVGMQLELRKLRKDFSGSIRRLTPLPVTFHINRATRKEAMKVHKLITLKNAVPGYRIRAVRVPIIYLNPAVDVISLCPYIVGEEMTLAPRNRQICDFLEVAALSDRTPFSVVFPGVPQLVVMDFIFGVATLPHPPPREHPHGFVSKVFSMFINGIGNVTLFTEKGRIQESAFFQILKDTMRSHQLDQPRSLKSLGRRGWFIKVDVVRGGNDGKSIGVSITRLKR
jgi:hypothetical protein